MGENVSIVQEVNVGQTVVHTESTGGQTMAVKNESNYEVSYILYYGIFNLVDKTVL